jgi:hypothetical protein
MTTKLCLRLLAAIGIALVAACSGIPQDGRYATFDGGRSNNRAEAPSDLVIPPA